MFHVFQAEFLKGLPSYNEHNFTRFHADSGIKSTVSQLGAPLHVLFLCVRDKLSNVHDKPCYLGVIDLIEEYSNNTALLICIYLQLCLLYMF